LTGLSGLTSDNGKQTMVQRDYVDFILYFLIAGQEMESKIKPFLFLTPFLSYTWRSASPG
jgi:hypothetical protein